MKRILLPILALLITCALLASCEGGNINTSSTANSSLNTTSDTGIVSDVTSNSDFTSDIASDVTSDGTGSAVISDDTSEIIESLKGEDNKDGLPPLNDELKQLFQKAREVYMTATTADVMIITGEDIQPTTINGILFHEVDDERFSNMDELLEYFASVFTEAYIADNINDVYFSDRFIEHDNKLYAAPSGRGFGLDYAGHYFEITEITTDKIKLKAYVYKVGVDNIDELSEDAVYDKEELDKLDCTVTEKDYEFTKTLLGWKISQYEIVEM